jgi:hypothetical protein
MGERCKIRFWINDFPIELEKIIGILENRAYSVRKIMIIKTENERIVFKEVNDISKISKREAIIEIVRKKQDKIKFLFSFELFLYENKVEMIFSHGYLSLIDEDPKLYDQIFEIVNILKDFLKPQRMTKTFSFHETRLNEKGEPDDNGDVLVDWDKIANERFNFEFENE